MHARDASDFPQLWTAARLGAVGLGRGLELEMVRVRWALAEGDAQGCVAVAAWQLGWSS
jgi:hypothetical protein